jgi:N-hydroxyarylamine O-acetyltransferase
MAALPDDVRDQYLARLGLDAEAPSVEALFRLHRAHVERVPWETLWIQMGERWGIDPVESARRVAEEGRGGYCFHLNGALGVLLESLGYEVTRHVGGVHGPEGPSEDEMTNHLVLTVAGLPHAQNPGGTWYLDAGLGDAIHDPLPLVPGTYEQGPHTYQLAPDEGPTGDWRFVHHPGRGFAGMAWLAAPTTMDSFAGRHTTLSTSPGSPFVRWLVLQRRHAEGVDVLQGLTLTKIGDGEQVTRVDDRDSLVDALVEVFGIDVRHHPTGDLDALWERVSAADAAHRESGSSA